MSQKTTPMQNDLEQTVGHCPKNAKIFRGTFAAKRERIPEAYGRVLEPLAALIIVSFYFAVKVRGHFPAVTIFRFCILYEFPKIFSAISKESG